MTPRPRQAIIVAALATLALLAADLGSKSWASSALSTERLGTPPPVCGGSGMQRLPSEQVVLSESYLELSYAENCGAAFGLLREAPDWLRRSIFGLAALAAAVVLFVMFVQGRGGSLFAYSVPLIVSGAVGNLVDRVRFGYVVDFIRFHLPAGSYLFFDLDQEWSYPTFNVADITITVGVALLVIDGFVQEAKAKKAKAGTSPVEEVENEAEGAAASDAGSKAKKRKKKKGSRRADAPAQAEGEGGAA